MGGRARLHICGNTSLFLEHLGTLGCEIVDLDYLAPMGQGRAKMGPNQILLGNMNPVSVLRNGNRTRSTRWWSNATGKPDLAHCCGWVRVPGIPRRTTCVRCALCPYPLAHEGLIFAVKRSEHGSFSALTRRL